jgi:glycerol-3-phosphate dehydrogenase
MKRDISALSGAVFDVCVVGGGITGVCVAHDAASRGLKVALLERGDFSEGTSSASTKLVHGGTRYLEHAEFGLVREALRERRLLLKLAPHLTQPLPFMIPLYRKGPVAPTLIRTGMLMYDMLSYDKNRDALADKLFPWHRYISPEEAVSLEPELEAKDLLGASVYTDGQMPNPMRLALEFAKTAAGNGAQLANYARVTGLQIEGNKVVGVEALDRLTGQSFHVTAAVTVNCAGIWATEVMKLLNLPLPVQLKPSKGIHVVTRPISKSHAVVSVSPTGRRVMIIPWRGKSLIGTTDDFYEGDIDRIRATTAEIQILLDEVNAFVPSARLTIADVEASYAGARPLVSRPGKSASDLSRKYQILDHGKVSGRPGLLSVLGGKYTTSRAMAEDIVDQVCKKTGKGGPCMTEQLPIGGGDIGVVQEYLERQKPAAKDLVDEACLAELVRSYGSGHVEVLDYVRKDPRLGQRIAPDRPFILAQVRHAAEHEMATSVADVALRRTDAGNMGDKNLEVGKAIAAELAQVLNLSAADVEKQLAAYKDQLAIDPAPAPAPAAATPAAAPATGGG